MEIEFFLIDGAYSMAPTIEAEMLLKHEQLHRQFTGQPTRFDWHPMVEEWMNTPIGDLFKFDEKTSQ